MQDCLFVFNKTLERFTSYAQQLINNTLYF